MQREALRALLQQRILVSDGAIGTWLQASGQLAPGDCPDLLNLRQPDLVGWVHQQYLAVGCDLIQTNTFGANPLKLSDYGLQQQTTEVNRRGAQLARQAAGSGALVAGNLGPTGRLLHPLGPLSFEQAEEGYYQQAKALVDGEVDLLLIETMSDLQEAKAAVRAVRAASSTLPVICSMTYTADLRTLTGADPETVVTVLEALQVDVVGTNCGFGPERMGEILQRQYRQSDSLLLVQPNAGLPRWQAGRTVFSLTPEGLAAYVTELVAAGASLIGGCCGTTPEHLRLLVEQARRCRPLPRHNPPESKLAGAAEMILIGNEQPTTVIGERINPTARPPLAEALRSGDFSLVAREAAAQVTAGAGVIDINVGLRSSATTEAELLPQAVLAAQRVISGPISLDTADSEAMRRALLVCRGKPLLNSTTGQPEQLQRVVELAKSYGAALVGLTLDEQGIPESAADRLQIAERIVAYALAQGIRREDVYIDGLTLTAGASQALVAETLRTIRLVKDRLGVRTVLGVSNVSHGLPRRPALNNALLAMALAAGLDLPIINPAQDGVWSVIQASDVLLNRDRNARRYLAAAGAATSSPSARPTADPSPPQQSLAEDLLTGEQSRLRSLLSALQRQGWPAWRVVDDVIIPTMEVAGERYEQRRFFLPQLLLCAEAAQAAFRLLQPELELLTTATGGTIVLATVKGDIHDIGKSIVGLLLRNHGFRVIDLGRDVDSERIVQAARDSQADLVALSSLMTTTMPEMGVVADRLRSQGLPVPLLIGGAVVTEEYAASIGAHYASDATAAVQQVKRLIKGGSSQCRDSGNACCKGSSS